MNVFGTGLAMIIGMASYAILGLGFLYAAFNFVFGSGWVSLISIVLSLFLFGAGMALARNLANKK
tara:strand:- start:542 stop:736 length:195 start_codon:yes stop_codon:yes gene_type:complete